MGTAGLTKTRSLQRFFPNFNPLDWQQIPTEQISNQSRFGQFKTYKNMSTNEWIDKYVLNFYSDKEQKIYQECFMQRLRQEYLVNAFHYNPIKTSGFCSNSRGAIVYIQHIPVRLCDITDVPFQQSLYIMKSALYGFQKLFNQSGYFQVTDQHIGIDKQGHVRVWLNSDLSKNYPFSFDDQTHQSKDYQKNMVSQIIKIIEQNTNFTGLNEDQNRSTKSFIPISTEMQRNNTNHPSYRQAQQLIRQYVIKYGIVLPKKCDSVVEIIESEYGQHFNVSNGSNFSEKMKIGNQFNQRSSLGNTSRQSDQIKIESSRNNLHQQNINQPLNIINSNSVINQNGRDLLAKQKNAVPSKYQYEPVFNYVVNDISSTVKKNSGTDSNQSNFDKFRQIRIQSRSSRQAGSQSNHLQGSAYNTNRSESGSSQRPQHARQQIQSSQMGSRIQTQSMSRRSGALSNVNINSSRLLISNIPKITFSYMNNNPQPNYQTFTKNSQNYNRQLIGLSKIESNGSQTSLISDLQQKNKIYKQKSRNQESISNHSSSQKREYIKNDNFSSQMSSQINERPINQRQIEEYQGVIQQIKKIPSDNEQFNQQKSIQQRIAEIDDQSSIDPEIMRDLLKQFPETDTKIL